MSSTKDWLFEVEAERCEKWIRETYKIPVDVEIQEGMPEWDEKFQEYQNMLEGQKYEWEEKEYEERMLWYEQHPYENIYHAFVKQRLQLKTLIEQSNEIFDSQMLFKMSFVHSVTLLEAMIGDMIKSLIVEHSHLMKKMALDIDRHNSSKKYSIKEIAELKDGINGIVMDTLSRLTYHNLETTKKILVALFGTHMEGLDIGKMISIVNKRHDFSHRNGKTTKGEEVELTKDILLDDMVAIDNFANDIYSRISVAMTSEK